MEWSQEYIDELKKINGIDAVAELERILSEELSNWNNPYYIAKQKRESREKKLKRIYKDEL